MAKRRVAAKGRVRLAVGLLSFLVVAACVIARRSSGVARARQMLRLDRDRLNLEAERTKLLTDVANASSLGQLGPLVGQRLGLQTPNEHQLIQLPRPSARRAP